MNIESLNKLIEGLEGPRSLREDKYYEALCFLRDALLHPNYATLVTAKQNAVLSGKEFMSIDPDGIITNLDKRSIAVYEGQLVCQHVWEMRGGYVTCRRCGEEK